MKRLIVTGAVLLGCCSSMVTGCGSRSSDNVFLPDAGASGNASALSAGFAGTDIGNGGDDPTAGSFPGAGGVGVSGAGGANTAGASGFVGQGGSAIAGSSSVGGAAGAIALGGASGFSGGGSTGVGGAIASGGAAGVAGGSSGSVGVAGADTGGTGAGGGNSVLCPPTTPNANSMCPAAPLQCNYTGRSCTCRQVGNNLQWRCAGSGDACPASEPAAASACMGTLRCPYPDGDQCNCTTATSNWNCFTAGCPTTKPTPSASCGSVFGQCTYGTGAGSACVCVNGAWFCN
jgi:hypothetical protein